MFSNPVSANEAPNKNVKCTIEIMPNYLWHLLSLSNVWNKDHSQYTEEYENTISYSDRQYIFEHRNYIIWGNGNVAEFTQFLFFIPFRNEVSPQNYFNYLDQLTSTLKSRNWVPFIKKFCPEYSSIADRIQFTNDKTRILQTIINIIRSNFKIYETKVWPNVQKILKDKQLEIETYFRSNNIIRKWEESLKMQYPYDTFYPVLTYANGVDNLVSGNNLSNTRDNFGVSPQYIDSTIDLIVHEIGIFTILPIVMDIFNDTSLRSEFNVRKNVVSQAVESYIEEKKSLITGKSIKWNGAMVNGSEYDFQWFFSFYKRNEDIDTPDKIIRKAIQEYEKEKVSNPSKPMQ
jgi:hypothetical protein